MIIYSNGLITLDYNPSTDILSVEMPDFRNFSISEVERALQIVVENIVNYDIKKLFLDSSKAIVEVEDEAYKNVILKFSMSLMKTRLKKLARIGSSIEAQEQRATRVAEEISKSGIPIEYKNFRDKPAAMEWLVRSA